MSERSALPSAPATAGLVTLQEPTRGQQALSAASITALVERFYADVRRDPLLGPVFEAAIGDHWEPHLQRMVAFWCAVALGEKGYRGNLVQTHRALVTPQAPHAITPAHFAAWVRLWSRHTEQWLQPEAAQQLQQAAHGVGRQLFRTMLGTPPPFDLERQAQHAQSHTTASVRAPQATVETVANVPSKK